MVGEHAIGRLALAKARDTHFAGNLFRGALPGLVHAVDGDGHRQTRHVIFKLFRLNVHICILLWAIRHVSIAVANRP